MVSIDLFVDIASGDYLGRPCEAWPRTSAGAYVRPRPTGEPAPSRGHGSSPRTAAAVFTAHLDGAVPARTSEATARLGAAAPNTQPIPTDGVTTVSTVSRHGPPV